MRRNDMISYYQDPAGALLAAQLRARGAFRPEHNVDVAGRPSAPIPGVNVGRGWGEDIRVGRVDIGQALAENLLGPSADPGMHPSPVKGGFGPAGYDPVRMSAPREFRGMILQFDSVAAIAPAVATPVLGTPQADFRGERLSVDGGIAPSFVINALQVGILPVFLGLVGAVPASSFGPGAVDTEITMPTAAKNQPVALNVTNIAGGALRFLGMIKGSAVL